MWVLHSKTGVKRVIDIDNFYFDNMVNQIYPSGLQLNKANTSDTEAAFLDLPNWQKLASLAQEICTL